MQPAPRTKSGGRKAGTPNRPKVESRPAPGAPPISPLAREAILPKTHSPFPPYKLTRTDSLVPYANNARTHSDAQVKQIAASIREFGFTNPVLTDGKRGIVAGHGRVLAAQLLGMDTLPAIELAHLTPAQRQAYVIADNRLALAAGWDEELLRVELDALKLGGFDLSLTGFDGVELDALFKDTKPAEAKDEPPEGQLDGKVCCPSCGHEFQTVAKLFRLIAGRK